MDRKGIQSKYLFINYNLPLRTKKVALNTAKGNFKKEDVSLAKLQHSVVDLGMTDKFSSKRHWSQAVL